jgi:hypothetical protein
MKGEEAGEWFICAKLPVLREILKEKVTSEVNFQEFLTITDTLYRYFCYKLSTIEPSMNLHRLLVESPLTWSML